MKNLIKLIAALLVMSLSVLFTGWVVYEVYQLVAVPIGLGLGLCMPHIPCMWFVLLMMGLHTITYKKPDKSYGIEDAEFWLLLVTKISTKTLCLLVVYILNLICF